MKFRLRRFVKILFVVTVCSVIGVSLFRQVVYLSEKVKTLLKHFPRVRPIHLESDGTKYDVGSDWFSFWNFTANLKDNQEFLRKHNKFSRPWSFDRSRLLVSTENTSIADYVKERKVFCGGAFICHAQLFAVLTNVLIDPSKGEGRRGGENISDVFNQNEESEYYKLSKGYFNLDCSKSGAQDPFNSFADRDHLKDWMSAVNFTNPKLTSEKRIKRPTIAVQRYEYANLYHTMTDFYNVFLMYLMFDLDPDSSNILWLDGHPKGGLDQTWKTLFGHVIRAGNIKNPLLFKTMIWNIMGYSSPIDQHERDEVPYLEEFRHFFLTQHSVTSFREFNCEAISVTFIWRRDYLAHPRNPEGHVQRKIKNEDELVSSLKSEFPNHKIRAFQLDRLPMQKQLQIIAETDILIGMHGAGLTHALFLPKHAALLELFPGSGSTPAHFKSIARWRGLKYMCWFGKSGGETHGLTTVNAEVVNAAVKELTDLMCFRTNTANVSSSTSRKDAVNGKTAI